MFSLIDKYRQLYLQRHGFYSPSLFEGVTPPETLNQYYLMRNRMNDEQKATTRTRKRPEKPGQPPNKPQKPSPPKRPGEK